MKPRVKRRSRHSSKDTDLIAMTDRLREAEETIEAIRQGQVDAVVVDGRGGPQVYTLRSADHPYRVLVEEMHEAALTLSAVGTILYSNQRFSELTGIPLEKIISRDFLDFVEAESRAVVRAMLASLPGRCEGFIRGTDRDVPVTFGAASIRVEGTVCIGLVVTDLTEQKRREAVIQAEKLARAELEEANRAKNEFLLTVSHELRTPLTSILGWATLLKSRAIDEDLRRVGMSAIEQSTRMQAALIEDLLDVSRIVSGKVRLLFSPVDIEAAIEAAANMVRGTAEAKHVRLIMTCERELPPVRGDANRLQQVLWNLLTNALKFTAEGGRIEISASMTDSRVCVQVRDTGCGIPAEFLPHVFERFSQADTSASRQYTGLGLGLSVVRDLVQLHGGTITASSTGQGSTFTVLLPAFGPEERPNIQTNNKDLGETPLSGISVLAVDDDPATRSWLTTTLKLFGASVEAASSVADALMCFEKSVPDVIISDLAMPVEDGLAFVARLRVREQGRQVPAIALTAFGRPEDRDRLLAAGFDEYLRKPIEASQLVRAVYEIGMRRLAKSGA